MRSYRHAGHLIVFYCRSGAGLMSSYAFAVIAGERAYLLSRRGFRSLPGDTDNHSRARMRDDRFRGEARRLAR